MLGLLLSILWKAESIPLSLVFLGNDQDLSHSDDMHSYLHAAVFPHLTQPPTVCPLVSQLFYILISSLSSWSYHTHLPHPNSAMNLSQIIIYAQYETGFKVNSFPKRHAAAAVSFVKKVSSSSLYCFGSFVLNRYLVGLFLYSLFFTPDVFVNNSLF